MDQIVLRVMRAVACVTRLEILRLLVREGELTPTALAKKLGISLPAVSLHLQRLASAGLIRRRPSGRRCYCIAESAYGKDALSGKMTAWLKRNLRSERRGLDSPAVRHRNHVAPGNGSFAKAVFEASTAFTNLRRIRLLARLDRRKRVSSAALTHELHMSPAALRRHLRKLARRGYVEMCDEAPEETCRLALAFKTPVHAELFKIVRAAGYNAHPNQ